MMSPTCNASPRATGKTRPPSSPQPPPLLPPPTSALPSPGRTLQPTTIAKPTERPFRRLPIALLNDDTPQSYTAGSSSDYAYSYPRLPQADNRGTRNSECESRVTPPPPPPPSILPSPQTPQTPQTQTPSLAAKLPPMALSPPATRHPPSGSRVSVSPTKGRTLLPSAPRSSSSGAISTWPPTTPNNRHSQASMHLNAVIDDGHNGNMPTTPLGLNDKARMGASLVDPGPMAHFPPLSPFPSVKTAPRTMKGALPPKSRRVRTGCLTCRERHLKCDEGVPDCFNCKKGNRECKRGLRLNFIDIQLKPIPYVPAVSEWDVSFLDESRLIASEYAGGLARYPRVKDRANVAPPRDAATAAYPAKRPDHDKRRSSAKVAVQPPPSVYYQAGLTSRTTTIQPDAWHQPPSLHPSPLPPPDLTREQTQAGLPALPDRGFDETRRFSTANDELMDTQCDSPFSETSSISSMVPRGMGPSSVASFQADVGNSRTSVETESIPRQDGGDNTGFSNIALLEGLPYEKAGLRSGRAEAGFGVVGGFDDISSSRAISNGEREYLNSPDEVLYMQVFVEDVGVWMDSFDKDKHFSRIIPYLALKSPMLLNASLACGSKHLALMNEAHQDGKALYYYNTATTQLSRSVSNPDRDIVECATTALVLNVYEIMSETPSDRVIHTTGARALILECGWNARSKGIGAACFWLNIGMEVLSCLAFNWQTAWDPDHWGLDTTFTNAIDGGGTDEDSESRAAARCGDEETWVHRIFYIVAKIANFRAGAPRFQEPSPHDEQARLEHRFSEWKRLKSLCDMWNSDCPRSMLPFSYLFPSQSASSGSVFPNIWLVKRSAVIGRLCYHTAMVLLHQVNPVESYNSAENLDAQRHHAHQVCGIVAHTKDRGLTNIAIRSLAISAHVLTDFREQDEVLCLLRRISDKTAWRTDRIYDELQHVWGRNTRDIADSLTTLAPSPLGIHLPSYDPHPAGMFAGFSGAAPTPASSITLPLPLSSYRGSVASPSPSGMQPPPQGPNGSGSLGRSHHLRMYSTTSVVSNTSISGAATAGSSPHSSPLSTTAPYRPPKVNPLKHAYFSHPGHPYKGFYKQPNGSAQNNAQSQAC